MDTETAQRIVEAKSCSGCIQWHKYCNAECCKQIHLNISSELVEKSGKYVVIRVKPLEPSDQRYYRLHGVQYARGTLKFLKERIIKTGNTFTYVHRCEYLDENNLCIGHENGRKPQLCKELTHDNANLVGSPYKLTDNCLFRYK